MTNEQQAKIKELRLKGLGYKAIATQIKLSRDVVRNYCKHHGLDGDACIVALNHELKMESRVICLCCQKPLRQKGRGRSRKFCSETCRRKWWKEHQEVRTEKESAIYSFVCAQCGKPFKVYGNQHRKYCSHDCYIKDRFWREEAHGI